MSQSAVSQSKTASTEDSPNLAEEAPLAEGQIAEGQTVTGQTIDPAGFVLSSLGSLSFASLVAPPAEAPATLNNGQPIQADASLFPAHSNPVLSLGGDLIHLILIHRRVGWNSSAIRPRFFIARQ
ncbi:MAG: hypothetical protein IH846_01985 [Acidobacteria bacterium]|nr:hypothetical protein [Acidobacteriota bacterium]